MPSEGKEKMSFITNQGTYCYNAMPFRLKNAEATFQRFVNKEFANQIGCNMEVYIDDIVFKSKKAKDHTKDLYEVFGLLLST